MNIRTESDITGEVAKKLRENLNMNQRDFWGSVGRNQSAGVFYERGREIYKPVRILIFAIYVLGLKIDVSTEEGVERAKYLAAAQKQAEKKYNLASLQKQTAAAKRALKVSGATA